MGNFIQWLKEEHQRIMATEREAMALLARDDVAGYRAKMREKADLIASLASKAEPELAALASGQRAYVQQGLARFSDSAATALSLDSPFYMSALLYRDDHKEGEPDNLSIFIEDLQQLLG